MGGKDKSLINLGGKPLVEHVLRRLAPQVDVTAINANGDASRFSAYGLPILPDKVAQSAGPLAGILAGMEWALAQDIEWLVTTATDTPFFPGNFVDELVRAAGKQKTLLATAVSRGRSHPTFGLWATSLRDDLMAAFTAEGVRKVDAWTAQHHPAMVEFREERYDPFFNINDPEEIAQAELILRDFAP